MVDLIGIEPMTSSMPWKRAPSCATGPHRERYSSFIVSASARFVKRTLPRPKFRTEIPPRDKRHTWAVFDPE